MTVFWAQAEVSRLDTWSRKIHHRFWWILLYYLPHTLGLPSRCSPNATPGWNFPEGAVHSKAPFSVSTALWGHLSYWTGIPKHCMRITGQRVKKATDYPVASRNQQSEQANFTLRRNVLRPPCYIVRNPKKTFVSLSEAPSFSPGS